ncbi:MAG: four helix bundle protein [Bacteroidetes bacterium]|nr:four helix bundle protein [Bacteroidota bacterium]MDA1119897.1 four helix bundle protein [Bacteroidota bacterium]
MATIRKFEDIEAWQEARELSKMIYKVTSNGQAAKDFGLRDQIRRSSGSVMDNIAEGFDRGGNKEFIHFLSIARGSAGEVRSQLCRMHDQSYIDKNEFDVMNEMAVKISNQISGLMNYLSKSDFSGLKFKR